jgi:hypothetical protein
MELTVKSKDIIGFIQEMKGAASKRFFFGRSENVQKRIAQHFLLILKDCGAAKGKKVKSLFTPSIGKNASRYAVFLARQESPGSHEILNHWTLRWWGNSTFKADEILRHVEYSQEVRGSTI